MEPEELFEEQIDVIGEKLLKWLETATHEDMLFYVKHLDKETGQLFVQLESKLLLSLRKKRTDFITFQLGSNAVSLLSESEIQGLVNYISQYNLPSVIKYFQQKFPTITFGNSQINSKQWADTFLIQWDNYFYLYSAQSYIDHVLYLRSLLTIPAVATIITQYLENSELLLTNIATSIAENNFQDHTLSTDLQNNIIAFAKSLGFLPEEYITGLLSSNNVIKIYSLFKDIGYVLDILSEIDLSSGVIKQQIIENILWESLRLDKEYEASLNYEAVRIHKKASGGNPNNDLYGYLEKIVTPGTLLSGEAQLVLEKYFTTLGEEQKKYFRDIFYTYVKNEPLFQVLLEEIDIVFILDQLKSQNLFSSRVEYINKLESNFSPELWLAAKQTLIFMATFI